MPPSRIDPERLAAQADWLRRLARHLVRDAHLADDVAQETLLVGLERAPAGAVSEDRLRAWLHNVARNLARLRHRTEDRRTAREREHHALRPATSPSSSDVVVRAAELRRLVDSVLQLDEPYRTAVLLAYDERLSAVAIARRTGVTPEAARKRVSRGLQQLRARLDESEVGDSRTWLAGLALVAHEPAPAFVLCPGVIIMATKLTAAVLVCLAALFIGLRAFDRTPAKVVQTAVVATSTELPEDTPPATSELGVSAPPGQRESVVAERATPVTTKRRLVGRVLLMDDRTPVVGASIFAGVPQGRGSTEGPQGEALAATDTQGGFAVDLDSGMTEALFAGGLWAVHADAFDVHVDRTEVTAAEGSVLEVRTVPIGSVLVRVQSPSGEAIEGANVEYDLDPTIGSDAQLWSYRMSIRAGTSDAHGELTVSGLPVGMPISLGLAGEWSRPARTVIDPDTRRVEVILTPTEWGGITVRLSWPDGSPASGVRVAWHGTAYRAKIMDDASGTSGEDGMLVIDGLSDGGGALIFPAEGFHEPLPLRVEPGGFMDLGALTVEHASTITGHLVIENRAQATERLFVVGFRSGVMVGRAAVGDELQFRLAVPRGPVALSVVRSVDWDPETPYAEPSLCGRLVDAPASDIELRLAPTGASLIGRLPVGSLGVVAALLSEEPSAHWGYPTPLSGTQRRLELDAQGAFRSQVEAPVRARVLLHAADGSAAYSSVLTFERGQVVDLGALEFERGALSVRVTGAPVAAGVAVTVADMRRKQSTERTDAAGVATFDLPVGPYAVRADNEAGTSGAWRVLHVEPGSQTTFELAMAEKAIFDGLVAGPNGPVAGVVLKTQREIPPTNLSWSATTNPDGRFEFQPLLPGTYRYWISGELVGRVTLAAGEPSNLSLSVGAPPVTVEVRRAGEPESRLGSLLVASDTPGSRVWRRGEALGDGRFRVALPDGPLLFQLDFNGLGNDQITLVPAPSHSSGTYKLNLSETGIELRLSGNALHSPSPAAYLEAIDGVPAVSSWGPGQEVYAEEFRRDDGTRVVRFPFLAPGTEVRIVGAGADGRMDTRRVRVEPGGLTVVQWP